MKISAVVVGLGARSALGLDALSTALCQRASAAGMKAAPLLDDAGEPTTMCFLPTLDPLETGELRAVSLGLPALDEAVSGLGPGVRGLRAKLFVGVDEFIATRAGGAVAAAAFAAGELHRRCREHVPQTQLEISARGGASFGYSLEQAIDGLARGTFEVAILGASHTDYEVARVRELCAADRLLKMDRTTGLLPGEAAAFAVLMRPDVARMMRLEPLANVHFVGTGWEKARPDNDEPSFEATGLTAAVRKVGAAMSETKARAGWILTDLTFETWRLNELQATIARTVKHLTEPMHCDSPAQRMGFLGSAAGAMHVVLAAHGFRAGYAPHPIALSLAGSDLGERAAFVLSA